MADLVDSYRVDVAQVSSALDGLDKSFGDAATGAETLGEQIDTTEVKVGRLGATATKLINQFDPLTKSTNTLAAAKAKLADAEDTLNAAMATGQDIGDQAAGVYATLQAKVDAAAAAVARAAATQNAYTVAANSNLTAFEEMQARADAYSQAISNASASQQAFNSLLGVQSESSQGAMAARAADMLAWGAAIDAVRAKYVPLDAAYQQSIRSQAEIGAALQSGILYADEAAAAIDKVTARYRGLADAEQAAKASASAATASQGQSIANNFAGVTPSLGPDDYAARAADIEAYGKALDDVRAKFDPLFAVSKQYEAILEEISAAEKNGAISTNVAEAARENATKGFQDQITAATGLKSAHGAAAAATRDLGIQFTQALSGIATGQPIFTTLIQQGHQVVDSSLAMGVGFKELGQSALGLFNAIGGFPTLIGVAVVGAIVAFGYAAETQNRQLIDIQQSLRATQTNYTTLAAAIIKTSHDVAASSPLSFDDALSAGKILASSKNFAGFASQLADLEKLSGDVAKALGTDVPTAARVLADALNDPTAAATRLVQEGFTGIDAATQRTIQRLQATGNTTKAAQIVMDAYKTSLGGASTATTPLQKALEDLSNDMTKVGSDGKSFSQIIGEAFTSSAAVAIEAISGWVKFLHDAYDLVKKIASSHPNTYSATGNTATTPDPGGGVPTLGTPIPLGNGQYQQATGIMQVLPSTAAGYNYTQDQISNSLSANISAGATDLVYKFIQANQDLTKALGNYGGASTAAGVASYNSKVSNADVSVLDPSVASQIHDTTARLATTLGLDDDTSEKLAATAQRIAVVESGGHQYATPEQLNRQNSYQNGLSPTTSAAQQQAIYGPTATPDQLAGLAASKQAYNNLNTQSLASNSGTTYADRQNVSDQITAVNAAISTATPGTDQYAALEARLDALKASYVGILDPVQSYFKNLTNASAATQTQDEASKALVEADTALNQASLQTNGSMASASDVARNHALVLGNLSAAYKKLETDADRQISSQASINAAYANGADAVQHANDYQQAYNATLGKYVEGSPAFLAAVDNLTKKYDGLARSKAIASVNQQIATGDDSLEYIQAETASVGQNSDARDRELAVLKATQEEHAKFGADLPEEAKKYMALTGNISDATAAYTSQKNAMDELSNFAQSTFSTIGNSIVQAFTTGGAAAINFGSIAKAALASVLEEVLKLAVLNPILNQLFGQNNTTISTVGGVVGTLLGNSGATAGAGVLGTVVTKATDFLGITDTSLTGTAGTPSSIGVPSVNDPTATLANPSGTGAAASGSGVLGTGVSSGTLLAGLGLASGIAALVQGKSVSLQQGLGLATGAYQVGSGLLTSAGTTVAANAAATNAALAGLAGSYGPATASAVGTIGGAGSALGSLGFSTSTGTFSGITTAINGAAEYIASGVVGAVNTVTGAVSGVATSIGSSLGIVADSTAAASAAVSGAATAASAAGSGASTAGAAAASAVSTVAGYLPYIGAAVSVVTDLAQGNYRGAGLVAGGAAVGAAVYGPIGAAVGAAVGALADEFLPNHPKNAYQATEVDASGGQLSVGSTVSQLDDPTQAISATSQWVDNVNTYLNDLHLAIVNNGKIGSVGQGIDAYTQVTDPALLLPSLRFTSTETNDNLGKTEAGDLPGHSFATPQDLANQLALEDQFATRMDALGLQLQAIGVDFKTISIAGVQQVQRADSANVPAGTDLATSDPTTAAFQDLLSDFRTALGKDLPNQSFADESALDTEIDKVYAFVSQTLPSMIDPHITAAVTSVQTGVAAIATAYASAETQAQAYGLSIDGLTAGMKKATQQYITESYADQITSPVQGIGSYLSGLMTSDASPASLTDQASAAATTFQGAITSVENGDPTSLSNLTGYADTALKTNKAVYGDGSEYADFYQSVTDALANVVKNINPDELTASIYQSTEETNTDKLTDAINAVQTEIAALRAEVQQGSATPARIVS